MSEDIKNESVESNESSHDDGQEINPLTDVQAQDTGFSLIGDGNPDATGKPVLVDGEKPEDLPDDLWDEEAKTFNIENLYKSYKNESNKAKGLRDKLAKGQGTPPKKPEDYRMDNDGDSDNVFEDGNPIVEKMKEICFENKVSKEVYNNIMSNLGSYIKENQDSFSKGEHLSEEQKSVIVEEEYRKIGKNAPAVIRAVTEWTQQLYNQGIFSEDELNVIQEIGNNGDAVRVLNKLRVQAGGKQDIPIQTGIDDSLPSDAEIAEIIGSQGYQSGDASVHAKVEDLLRRRTASGRPERLQF